MADEKKPKGIRGIKITEMSVEEKIQTVDMCLRVLAETESSDENTEAHRIIKEILKSIQ